MTTTVTLHDHCEQQVRDHHDQRHSDRIFFSRLHDSVLQSVSSNCESAAPACIQASSGLPGSNLNLPLSWCRSAWLHNLNASFMIGMFQVHCASALYHKLYNILKGYISIIVSQLVPNIYIILYNKAKTCKG